jgi:hypothetical protein
VDWTSLSSASSTWSLISAVSLSQNVKLT